MTLESGISSPVGSSANMRLASASSPSQWGMGPVRRWCAMRNMLLGTGIGTGRSGDGSDEDGMGAADDIFNVRIVK
jgi:hypothetical protein